MQHQLKICFVGIDAYPLFNPRIKNAFGGAEVRSYLISTQLATYPDYDVSFVVGDYGQPSVEVFQNIKVFSHPGYSRLKLRRIDRYKRDIFADSIPRWKNSFPYIQLRNHHPVTWLKLIYWFIYAAGTKISKALKSVTDFFQEKVIIQDQVIKQDRFKIYDQVDADVYCILGVIVAAAEVAAYCQLRGKHFMLFIAGDSNLDEKYQRGAVGQNSYQMPYALGYYTIRMADLIYAQTRHQKDLLKTRFGRDSILINNPVDLESHLSHIPDYIHRTTALWIGRADNHTKLPLVLIRLAKACPDIHFKMIMNGDNPQVSEEVYRTKPVNVDIYNWVPFDEVERFFAESFVLVSTSRHEGFPNIFLQAGKYGVPILSLKVDPDHFIEKYACGIVAHDNFDALVAGLRRIQADQPHQQYSRNMMQYVHKHHRLEDVVAQIHQSINTSITPAARHAQVTSS